MRKLKQGPFRGAKIAVEPRGEVKMSKALTDFVEPYLELANIDTTEDYQKLLTLAIVAWNASLLPEEEQQDMIDTISDEALPLADEELKAGLKEITRMLIARKKKYFSEYARTILEFELTDTRGGHYLAVVSTLIT